MQRIKRVRWPVKNIGGDKSFCKLRYVSGAEFAIEEGTSYTAQNQAMAIGATISGTPLTSCSLSVIMGDTPNLSTMGALYTNYRIRGIKLRLTYWQISGAPCFLFAQAAPDPGHVLSAQTGPNPPFIIPNITTLPEQRWGKYRVCQLTSAGGAATSLSAYYSVNKVQGPDAVVRNDPDYTGSMMPTTPYFSNNATGFGVPTRTPWMQYGVATLGGGVTSADSVVTGVLKVEQTVYCEFFGKRPQTQ